MSKFITTIKVPVETIKAALPKRAFVHSVTLGDDNESVVVEWDCDQWNTPFSVPVEVSLAQLENTKTLPKSVIVALPPAPEESAECKRVQNQDVEPKSRIVRKLTA